MKTNHFKSQSVRTATNNMGGSSGMSGTVWHKHASKHGACYVSTRQKKVALFKFLREMKEQHKQDKTRRILYPV